MDEFFQYYTEESAILLQEINEQQMREEEQ
jgi:hypothetical protein